MAIRGTIYLIHFDRPIGNLSNPKGQAQHYIGWSSELPSRIKEHAKGHGAAIMAFVVQQGIPWWVMRTWRGTRYLERKLKNKRKARQLCPFCNANLSQRIRNRAIPVSDKKGLLSP